MLEFIELLKENTFGEMILTFFAAMLPILELRGAIPFGIGLGLDPWVAYFLAVIGNMIPVPFIIIFIRKIFAWLRPRSKWLDRFITKLEHSAEGKWEKVRKYELLGLIILVAIPLPGTGAWTGALIAALMDLRLRISLPAITIGVVIAGFLVLGLSMGFTALF